MRCVWMLSVLALLSCRGAAVPTTPTCDRVAQPTGRIAPAGLMRDVTYLASEELAGRGAGTPESVLAQRYLAQRLGEVGASTTPGYGWRWPYAAFVADGSRYDGANVIGQVAGTTRRDRWIVLSAHYDHLGTIGGQVHPGADDNASGVAAVLAIAERLVEEPLAHSVLLVFFDGEERHLSGARAYLAEPAVPTADIVLNLNLDMVARGDDGNLWLARSPSLPSAGIEKVIEDATICLQLGHDGTDGREDWTPQGDHLVFHQSGIPFAYFGVEDHADYHQPTDLPDRIDELWFAAAVETIEAALRALDADLLAAAVGGA